MLHLAGKPSIRWRPVNSTLGSMKHASSSALHQLNELLDELGAIGGLREPKTGIFYRGSSAFLHFHEDPAGLFADAKLDGKKFTRFSVSQQVDQADLLKAVRSALDRPTKSK